MNETPLQIACKRYGKNGNPNYKTMKSIYSLTLNIGKAKYYSNMLKAHKAYSEAATAAGHKPKGYSAIAAAVDKQEYYFEAYDNAAFKIEKHEIN